jgi:signal transduction histidine kinase
LTFPAQSTAAREWRLRSSLVFLLVIATVGTFGIVGFAALVYRVPIILEQDRQHVRAEAIELAHNFEQLIDGLEGRLATLTALRAEMPPAQIQRFLDAVVAEGGFKAIYLVGENRRIAYAAAPGGERDARQNLLGADLSRNPLYSSARELGRRVWSDRYLSPLNGEGTVGLAIPFGDQVLLGELALHAVHAAIRSNAEQYDHPVLVVDRAGEYVVGENVTEGDRLRNWAADLRSAAFRPEGDVREMRFSGAPYDTGIVRSNKLEWIFMVTNPAGHGNPRVRVLFLLVLGGFAISLLLAVVLAPFWALPMTGALNDLIAQTRALTSGKFGPRITRGPIQEFNQLASDMESMAGAIRQRQAELEQSEERLVQTLQTLQSLNVELESRVERRTADLARANSELSSAMETLKMAQGELVRSEKLAALGNLVGGVAHELNTPIGNGVMAVSTVHDHVRDFRRRMESGLWRPSLEAFVDRVERGSEIAVRNLQRANELLASFKQVAIDQTSAQRRQFMLSEVVDEILLTLQPTFKRTPFKLYCQIPVDLTMDSYPGPLGQVLTNLLTNSLQHGFEGRASGRVEITAERQDDGRVCLQVADNGIGIPPDLLGRIFDPFVTSKLGRGGNGLGLHIVWNTVNGVLGGTVSVDSSPERGTRFRIILPVVAPSQLSAD